ncbi:hypothetical protein [Faecalibacillus intestinalis]|nr:hypothetical protein [Faecalibacillus intestinalis]
MEQKDYYYKKGMQYEFDRKACHAAIEHYINDIDKFSSRQVGK